MIITLWKTSELNLLDRKFITYQNFCHGKKGKISEEIEARTFKET